MLIPLLPLFSLSGRGGRGRTCMHCMSYSATHAKKEEKRRSSVSPSPGCRFVSGQIREFVTAGGRERGTERVCVQCDIACQGFGSEREKKKKKRALPPLPFPPIAKPACLLFPFSFFYPRLSPSVAASWVWLDGREEGGGGIG